MNTIKNVNDNLNHFCGSERVYRHAYGFVYTEGIQFLMENYQCYWLVQDIYIYSQSKNLLLQESFQVWKLKRVSKTGTVFTLIAEDGNYNVLFETKIPFSDFKGDEVTIWHIQGTMLLPSEY